MRRRRRTQGGRWLVGGLLAVLALPGAAAAADQPGGPVQGAAAAIDPETQKMMELIERMGSPGGPHAELMKHAGRWQAVLKSWTGPGAPILTQGVATMKPTLGGRFLMEEYKGTLMGKPFEGIGFTGYDNQHKEYVSVWFDTMITNPMISRGTMDASGRVLTMKSEWEDPATGEKSPVRMVTTLVDADTRRLELFETHAGQEVKSMEITYTRMR